MSLPKLRFSEFWDGMRWEEEDLSKLCSCGLSNGVFNDPKKVGRGYKLINVLDMYIDTEINEDNLSLVELSREEFLKNKVENGDLFFTRSSLVKSGIAYSNIYLGNSNDITFDGHLIRFRTNKEILIPIFTNYLLRTNKVRSQLVARGKTATMTTIGQADVGSVKLSFPHIDEQKKIADCLSSISDRITLEKQKLDTLRAHKKGLMQQLFPAEGETLPKLRFPEFQDSGKWEEKSISELPSPNDRYGIVDGPFGSNLKIIHYRSEGIPIITSGYVTDGIFNVDKYLYVNEEKFAEEKRSAVRGGDIVMAKIGARCGASAIMPEDHAVGILSGNALKITIDNSRFSTNFVWQMLWELHVSSRLDALKAVGAQPAISISNLKKYKVTLPSLPEQKKIADCFSSLDEAISLQSQAISLLKQHKKGLMQQLFPSVDEVKA